MTRLGDWDLLEPVGAGAHGVVHRAVHRDRPGRVVAIKRLRDVDVDVAAALRREADVLADLQHPAVAVLHEVVPDGDGVALVLALATGGTLAARLERSGRLPATEVADLGRRLGSALAAAHDAGVLHRDVKPSNVLYGREDEPRLADFGLAGRPDRPPDEVAGTATYLDPEVAGGGPPGPASDTWSLGVLLWEALAGQPPWLGADDRAVRRAADRGEHLPLDDLVPDAPPDLVAVLERSIERDPAHRFAHPQELELALAGLDLAPVPGSTPTGSAPTGSAPTGAALAGGIAFVAGEPATSVADGRDHAADGPDDTPSGEAPSEEMPSAGRERAGREPAVGEPAVGGGAAEGSVGGQLAGDRPAADPRAAEGRAPAEPALDEPRGIAVGDDGPDRGTAAGGTLPEWGPRTTVFGPRPPRPEPRESSSIPGAIPGWTTRVLVAVALVVPLAVAGWAVLRTRDAAEPGAEPGTATPTTAPDDPAPSAEAGAVPAVSPSTTPGTAPGPVDRPTPSATPSAIPSATPSATPGARPEPTAASTATPVSTPTVTPAPTPTPTVVPTPAVAPLPSGWRPRRAGPLCPRDRRTPLPPDDPPVLRGDVDGSDCARRILVRRQRVDGGARTVLVLPPNSAGLAGRYDLGPAGDVVVVGDWDGDGIDTPAVVRATTGEVFTFDAWTGQEGQPSGDGPLPGSVAVATDRRGRDHVVDAARLAPG